MSKDLEKFEKFLHYIECIYEGFTKIEKYGIEFYKIGDSESNSFYIGCRDGLFFKSSEGEGIEPSMTCHFNFGEVSDNYLGHF